MRRWVLDVRRLRMRLRSAAAATVLEDLRLLGVLLLECLHLLLMLTL
jgi:hypothetical protein